MLLPFGGLISLIWCICTGRWLTAASIVTGYVVVVCLIAGTAFFAGAKPMDFDLAQVPLASANKGWVGPSTSSNRPGRFPHFLMLTNGERTADVRCTTYGTQFDADGQLRAMQVQCEWDDQRGAVDSAREVATCLGMTSPPLGKKPDELDEVHLATSKWNITFATWNLQFPNVGYNKFNYGYKLIFSRR